jgi:DNA polymerase alpha subunit B
MGAGMRVPLRLDGLGYDFFPGKIVALRGTNVSGEYFSATEILEMPELPISASTPAEFDDHNVRLTSSDDEAPPLNMLVASGPYTMDTDLSFAPLQALLNRAEEHKADVLILTGPFLDLEHPLLASGDFEDHLPANTKIQPDRATLIDVFRILISQPIQNLAKAVPTITIILVPSTRDAISKHVSWPQDRFPKQQLGLPKQVQVVTNPITLSINEMIIGTSSQDVLSEMRRENVHHAGKGQAFSDDFMARLASNVIEQRHFFPVFPPQGRENLPKPAAVPGEVPEAGAEERLAVGASLDLGYLKLGEWLNVRPDMLILPSVLNPFAKVCLMLYRDVKSCLANVVCRLLIRCYASTQAP